MPASWNAPASWNDIVSDDQILALHRELADINARLNTMPTAQDFADLKAELATKPSKAFVWQITVGTGIAIVLAYLGLLGVA